MIQNPALKKAKKNKVERIFGKREEVRRRNLSYCSVHAVNIKALSKMRRQRFCSGSGMPAISNVWTIDFAR